MATLAARHGRSSLRNGRLRSRHDSGEEVVQLDYTREPKENVREVLLHIVRQHGVSKSKKLAYLNAFVKFLYKIGNGKELPFTKEEIFCCLRIGLLHEAKEVRAATLRTIRYLLSDQESLDYLFSLHIDLLIARCIDVCLDNEVERVHALRLIRKISQLNPHKLTPSLIHPLIAVGNEGSLERDRMTRVCLATICEIAFHNASVIASCGGISTILHNIVDCQQYPRVNESLVATILYLLNHPRTRHYIKINIDLEQLVAPFTDCHYKHTGADSGEKSLSDDKESRFAASKMAIVTVMKSWPGMIRLCRPDGSGLQSLVGILYLPNAEIRKNIVDMLYDLFRLQICEWTSDFSVALLSTDPSQMRDSWRLGDGFVAEEGRSLLSHHSTTRPNLVENHQALILSAWINANILEALVEVTTTSDGPLFVRTIILLGELVHLASTILPVECVNHCQRLPTLIGLASSRDVPPQVQNQANLAINCLNRIHALKKRGPVPHSLYLEQIVTSCRFGKLETSKPLTFNRSKLLELYCSKTASEDMVNQALRDCQVLSTKENVQWEWDLITAILQWTDGKTRKLEDLVFIRFLRRLVFFYKPTNHLFSALDINSPDARKVSSVGCLLVEFLLNCEEEEGQKQIFEWLSDVAHCLAEVSVSKPPSDAVLGLGNINKTLSQDYFLLVGKFSASTKGDKWLERSGVYQQLLELISISCHEKYVKLTTSSLCYSRDGLARVILSKSLTASTEPGRIYTTKLLRVLLRAGAPYFYNWGIDFLVTQLYDVNKSVAMTALHVLEEACESEANLEALVKMRPSLLHLGDRGVLMLCRLLAIPKGFRYLADANYVTNELEKWNKIFNRKYVKIVEELLNEALTTYEKTYDGSYTRRSSTKRPKKNAYVPAHLYGQLVQHKEGFNLLKQQEYMKEYMDCVRFKELITDEDTLTLKTALWAIGHIGRSGLGITWLQEEEVIPTIIKLAEECAVFSIRGTAFYALGLMSSTRQGCLVLAQYGWESLWHTRGERWPVLPDKDVLEQTLCDDNCHDSVVTPESLEHVIATLAHELPSKLFYIEEEEKKDGSDHKKQLKSQSLKIEIDAPSESMDQNSSVYAPDGGLTESLKGGSAEFLKGGSTESLKGGSTVSDSFAQEANTVVTVSDLSVLMSGNVVDISETSSNTIYNSDDLGHQTDINVQTPDNDLNMSDSSVHSYVSGSTVVTSTESSVISVTSTVLSHKDSGTSSDIENSAIERTSMAEKLQTKEIHNDCDKKSERSPSPTLSDIAKRNARLKAKFFQREGNFPKSQTMPFDGERQGWMTLPKKRSSSLQFEKLKRRTTSEGDDIDIRIPLAPEQDKSSSNPETLQSSAAGDSSKPYTVKPGIVMPINKTEEIVTTLTKATFDTLSDKLFTVAQGDVEKKKVTMDIEKKTKVFEVTTYKTRPSSLRDDRSNSNESNMTSKSRSDSFNTGSTSGIGSCESAGAQVITEAHTLSPIASTTSLTSLLNKQNTEHSNRTIHPSSFNRKLANLNRVPSLRRQPPNPALGVMSAMPGLESSQDNPISYTSSRDVHGYATLRIIQRQRTLSSDIDPDFGLAALYDEEDSRVRSRSVSSWKSTESDGNRAGMPKNSSFVSAQEYESSQSSPYNTWSRLPPLIPSKSHNGQAEFLGLCLPVDVTMVFQVNEGEDRRTASVSSSATTGEPGYTPRPIISEEDHDSKHETSMCLSCHRRQLQDRDKIKIHVADVDTDISLEDADPHNILSSMGPSPPYSGHLRNDGIHWGGLHVKMVKSRASSTNDPSSTAGSLTSTTDTDSTSKKMSEDSDVGRAIIRREILKLITNLSSSVGAKASEQGLLHLKRKFPRAFRDLCLYSDIAILLGNYSFRLNARRFIQELFDDLNTAKLLDEPRFVLGLDETDVTRMATIRQDSLDEFSDTFR